MYTTPALAAVITAAGTLLLYPAAGLGADSKELAEIQQQIEALKIEYEARIKALEARLQAAEKAARAAESKADAAQTATAAPAPLAQPAAPSGAASANAFNPSIGVILDAKARYFSRDVDAFQIPGFSLPDEGGIGAEGLSLGESELNLSANVDDKFYGNLTVSLEDENGDTTVAVEEAYVQTLVLPAGFTLKGGRFFSNIGYLNSFHTHADDFADRPLPYRVFLNKQFGDDGVQVRWIAPTDVFVELGGELLRGASFPAGGASDDGKGMWTLFGHIGGDAGVSNSWRAAPVCRTFRRTRIPGTQAVGTLRTYLPATATCGSRTSSGSGHPTAIRSIATSSCRPSISSATKTAASRPPVGRNCRCRSTRTGSMYRAFTSSYLNGG